MRPTIVPFVKWAGGKRQLLKEIVKKLPSKINTYYEPFVGGGALLFFLKHPQAVIFDTNTELINAYKVVKNKYKKLREYLILMEYGHSETFYKLIRQIDQNDKNDYRNLNMHDSDILKAARFIYLNKAGFNGLYRVNSQGFFNVPSSKKAKVKTHEWPNIQTVSEYLSSNNIKILNQSFEKVISKIQKEDFVYFDPPYDYEKGIKGFDSYQKETFGQNGQIKLANVCKELNKKRIKFMVSNHNTKLINNLYKEFNIYVLKAKRLIGGKGASRADVEEVLITNYVEKTK